MNDSATHDHQVVDVDDTSNCPTAAVCATCGETDELMVETVSTPVGVYCLTLCAADIDNETLPAVGWAGAVDLVGAHCVHLGIDVDQMAAILEAADRAAEAGE
jgi:hypothetical protein